MADAPRDPAPTTTSTIPLDYDDRRPLSVGEFNRAVYAMRDRTSLRRNGHSIPGWIGKLFTIERGLLLLVALFTGYGEWRDLKAGLYTGKADTAALKVNYDRLTTKVDDQTKTLVDVQATLAANQNRFATKADLAVMQEQIRLNISRREFQEFQRSVLPALQRIERRMATKTQ